MRTRKVVRENGREETTDYSENDISVHMQNAGFKADYSKIIINVPYENAVVAVSRVFELCGESLSAEILMGNPNHYVGYSKIMKDRKEKRVTYDIFSYSCFAFVDRFCNGARVSLKSIIGPISEMKDDKEQYLFAQNFLPRYSSYLSGGGRFICIPGKMSVFISNADMQARRPR